MKEIEVSLRRDEVTKEMIVAGNEFANGSNPSIAGVYRAMSALDPRWQRYLELVETCDSVFRLDYGSRFDNAIAAAREDFEDADEAILNEWSDWRAEPSPKDEDV